MSEKEDIARMFNLQAIESNGTVNPAYESDGDLGQQPGKRNRALATKDAESSEEEVDPYALPELEIEFTPWSELTTCEKIQRVLWHYIGKPIILLGLLYLFICSLGFLGDAFKLLGGKQAGQIFSDSKILSNPVAGVMIGVLATVLLQSSSTTTSIVVSMVAEKILTVELGIPIVMGANIGTSVTNTIVSMGQIANKGDFRRAFAGATVHDMFNWLTVIVLLPVEVITEVIFGHGYLFYLSRAIVDSMHLEQSKDTKRDFLKKITKPFTKQIIQIDKKVIQKIAQGEEEAFSKSIIKHCCDKEKTYFNQTIDTFVNGTNITSVKKVQGPCKKQCEFLFEHISNSWSDEAVGAVLLVLSLAILIGCLIGIVKVLQSLLKGQMASAIRKFVNGDFACMSGKNGNGRGAERGACSNFGAKACSYFGGYLALLLGAGFTILVQSSSVFTSSLTPLVGMGVISLESMYPLTLGANIGTTTTGILAALAQDALKIPDALQIAFCHLFFNVTGIVIFFAIPFFRPPIYLAKFLGNETAKYRWYAIAYLILMFFVLPAVCFGLSSVSWIALAAVLIPVLALFLVVLLIKLLQHKTPRFLPVKLRNWKFLPKFMRSLEPYDRMFMAITCHCACCRKVGCCQGMYIDDNKKEVFGKEIAIVNMNGKETVSPETTDTKL